MINEKELRTGNIYTTVRNHEIMVKGIDTLNKYVTINSSADTEITAKNESSVIFEDLNPIEITAKSIAQFGLEADKSLSVTIIADNEVRLVWSEKLNQVVLVDAQDGKIGQEIRYVHQLQNIYYFLTGKELPMQ